MASSKVHLPSAPLFDSPLRHSLRGRIHSTSRDSSSGEDDGRRTTQASFQNQLTLLVSHIPLPPKDTIFSSGLSPTQARLLDRWSMNTTSTTKKTARTTRTTTERLTHDAELMALSNTHAVSSRASTFIRDPSPPLPPPAEIPNLGASSMVQKWRIMELRRLQNCNSNTDCSNTNDGEADDELDFRRWRSSCTSQGDVGGVQSPRVRGRGAVLELLERVAGDRKVELEGLEQRQSVSRFSQRVRIQSVLRLRLCNGIPRSPLHASDHSAALSEQSAVSTLRQRFHSGEVNGSGGATEPGSNERGDAEDQSSRCTEADTSNREDPKPEEHVTAVQVVEEEDDKNEDEKENEIKEDENEDEEEEDEPVQGQAPCDWVSHISRPQRDWENSRRARYEEMMLHDNEICRLLDRRSVSSFLVSEYKDRMDRLMTSIARRQTSHSSTTEEQNSVNLEGEKREERVEEDTEEAEGVDEEYCYGGENSSDILSPSPPHPSRSHSSTEFVQTHHLANDIEQLRHEMQELKKLIKSSHPKACVKSKGDCLVCHEKEVDSLLYRCGHVCTCIKCGRELKGGRKPCPVCEAPIDDVVQIIVPPS